MASSLLQQSSSFQENISISPLPEKEVFQHAPGLFSIMSVNLRGAGLSQGLNSWDARKNGIARMIEDQAPIIIGTQEGSPTMLQYLEYATAGKYKRYHSVKESSTMYDPSKVEILKGERFLVSFPGSGFPKHCSYIPYSVYWVCQK